MYTSDSQSHRYSLIDRYTLDAFADSGFDFEANSLDNEDALLYRFMKEFNHSAAADNPIAGLAHEKIYPQPEKFIPERFSPEEIQKRHAFSYLPYGQGPRMCPGLKFADLQVKVAMVKLLQRFVIKPCSQTIDPLPTALRPMLCPKDGVFVHLEDRVRPNMRSNTCSA
ncbi:CYP5A [Mytilus edulis]|uniref:TBXAS1 n=1 Tax=Mytilus edulis TaxID=6550 RepID=A0A8S3TPV7_MYTED|nr:CYP5A [Mytilus edulis]